MLIPWFSILLLGPLVLLVWILATWRRRGWLARTFVVGCTLILFVGMLRVRQSVRLEHRAVVSQQMHMQEAFEAARSERVLHRSSTDGLEPDVYPGVRSALLASTRGLLRDLVQVVPEGVEVRRVLVTGIPDSPLELDLRGHLVAEIHKRLPRAEVHFDAVAESQPVEATQVALQVEPPLEQEQVSKTIYSGGECVLKISLRGEETELTRHAHVVSRQWVEDLQKFRTHRGRHWMVAESPGFAASTTEALQAAYRAAAQQLLPMVRASAWRRPDFYHGMGGDEPGHEVIGPELANGSIVRDVFVQQFDRGYGRVYRAAVLIDASESQLERLADVYVSHLTAQRTRLRHNVLSGAGLILVILLVYAFLNAATKGYYVWSVRLACTMLLAAGVFTLIVLA